MTHKGSYSVTCAVVLAIVKFSTLGECERVFDFHCYQCSYQKTSNESWSRPECIDNPAAIGENNIFPCKANQYCYLQVMFDTKKQEITAFDRRCSATDPGIKCTPDWNRVICTYTCQGRLCTRNIGREIVDPYIRNGATPRTIGSFSVGCLLSVILYIVLT